MPDDAGQHVTDQFSGQGGSYRVNSDGTRSLVFRTGLGSVEKAATKRRKPEPQPETQEDMSDGEVA